MEVALALLLLWVGQVHAATDTNGARLAPALVQVGQVGVSLSPVLYSVFLETEINFGGEGGLYAELIRNRDFETLGRGSANFEPSPPVSSTPTPKTPPPTTTP